ncbi:MAG: pyruvate ferredoxin oxidoreductase [Roseibacillus sp.]|jgi:2-oxoglutarate ferredoxin oxidoreductase subunit beta|nr:pyruvate ferredoxin oxidoreductase [Roseibacillus sp.]MBP36183.1 pyruvate ferredoxin oxidoreductase [Roseibacillus sp.]MCP4731478.1 pyruvate ferredoxin oxidoreductase [Roseibacillus sp.]MDP6209477.1 thiamine pyrophosphate-dependent enzyme [Roseibacillus sp.]MDP7105534.1 thiamine pyrophosphate-dependent enzyme [Roseibacillus sp.]|tara:strand:+ start:35387 stop:36286 length:900 start_codon:yes stop_codon:yes gene_type:complete
MSDSQSAQPEEKLSKKQLKADHPTWCPGCGDFAVLASFFNVIQKLGLTQTDFVCVAGIGCSSRFPYFVNSHGIHFIHGRALPLATGISLSRPDQHVFVFGGDGDGFSIGGNHLNHAARKNINLTYVIMDNCVYGLTKNQTSPTTPIGRRSKTDPQGSADRPINPMAQLLGSSASFIARSHAAHVKHMTEMFERAVKHPGFSVVEVLSECTMFYPGAFDAAIPRKGGEFNLINEEEHDLTSTSKAFDLAQLEFPGKFGVFYQDERPSKNDLEQKWINETHDKQGDLAPQDLMRQKFAAMQ